jgi:hypothetical protein
MIMEFSIMIFLRIIWQGRVRFTTGLKNKQEKKEQVA